jgi:hypothetical protein
MAWPNNPRPAKSLIVLRNEIDAAFPNRSRASDGMIGDAAHQAQGSASDHNPWFKDDAGRGVVTALDITHDPNNGPDIDRLSDELLASRNPLIKYVIANGLILIPFQVPWADDYGWKWQKYTGDPHTNHIHISVNTNDYDDESPWGIGGSMRKPIPPEIVVQHYANYLGVEISVNDPAAQNRFEDPQSDEFWYGIKTSMLDVIKSRNREVAELKKQLGQTTSDFEETGPLFVKVKK